MKILVGCEKSGALRRELRRLGHDAYSCDILPAEDGDQHHIQGDLMNAIAQAEWEALIAFPPCTDLCVSGARWFPAKRADGRQQRSIEFFMAIVSAPILRIGIENPIGIMSSVWRKPDQIIQPWQFGHGETKATCLWLKNLPLLTPTEIVSGREARVHRMAPGPKRAEDRSRTYSGIARAMAEQWFGRSAIEVDF